MLLRNTYGSGIIQHQQQRRRGSLALLQHIGATAAAPLQQPCARRGSGPQRRHHVTKARGDEDEPDWDKEMSIFKQRTMCVKGGGRGPEKKRN